MEKVFKPAIILDQKTAEEDLRRSMNDNYVYQQIQKAMKETLQDAPLLDRMENARMEISVISEGHYDASTPDDLKKAIAAFASFDPKNDAGESATLLYDIFNAALR